MTEVGGGVILKGNSSAPALQRLARSAGAIIRVRHVILFAVLPFALGISLHLNSLSVLFLWDDFRWLEMGQTLNAAMWGYYRPGTTFSFRLDEMIYGHAAWGFHLSNVLIHSTNILLVGILALALGYKWRVAFLAILLFAFHGSHWDAVTIVAGRPTLLGALFLLLSFILLILASKAQRKLPLLALSLVSLLVALLTKESGLFFPVAVVYLCLFFFKRGDLNRPVYMAAVVGVISAYVVGSYVMSGLNPSSNLNIAREALAVLFEFFRMLAVPTQMGSELGLEVKERLALCVLAGFAVIWILLARRGDRRKLALLSLGLLALLLSAPLYGAARLLYVPLFFLAILAADLISSLFSLRMDRRVLAPIIVILLVGLGVFWTWHFFERRERDRSIAMASDLVTDVYSQMQQLVPNPERNSAFKFAKLTGWGPGPYPFRTFGGTVDGAIHWIYGRMDLWPVTSDLDYLAVPEWRWDLGATTHYPHQKLYSFVSENGKLRLEQEEEDRATN